jgi:hypothetical protein
MSLIKNQAAADAIAASLPDGVNHPGNPDTKQPAARLVIPMFRTHGLPPPLNDAARRSNQTIAEAIVYFVETQLDSTIIPNPELEQLRLEAAQHEDCPR